MTCVVVQVVVEWQSLQVVVVVMWPGGRPVAVVPLWQLTHVPVTEAWLKLTDDQLVGTWQSLQAAVVATWLAGLPLAIWPL